MKPELTPRERKVWIHVAHGRKQSAIAQDLGITVDMVKQGCRRISRKLGLPQGLAALVRATATDLFFPA